MMKERIIKSFLGTHKVYNSEQVTELNLWCTYLNNWGDRFLIATRRTDGLFVGYTYANPQPSLFTEEGKYVGFIDFNGVEHLDKRVESFDLDVLECKFTPWREPCC